MTPRFSTIRKARFRIAQAENKWLRLSPRPPAPPRLSYIMAEEAKVISVNKAAVKIALLIKTQKTYKVSRVNWIKYALKTNSSNVRKQITDRNIPIFSSITYSNRISRMLILQRRQSSDLFRHRLTSQFIETSISTQRHSTSYVRVKIRIISGRYSQHSTASP